MASSRRGSSSSFRKLSCSSGSALAGIMPTLRGAIPIDLRNSLTLFSLRLIPVSSSILAIASLTLAGGCLRKYSSIVVLCWLNSPLLIRPQVTAQCIERDPYNSAYLSVTKPHALQPKSAHFTLHSRIWIVITPIIQCLLLFLGKFYLNHLYHLFNFIYQTKRWLTLYKFVLRPYR